MNDYLTVKEYAELNGITEQAVYKSIRAGRLAAEDLIIDGKCKKMIFCPGPDPDPQPAPGSEDPAADPHPGPDSDPQQPPSWAPPWPAGSEDPAADPRAGQDPDLAAAAFQGSAAGHQGTETAALEAAIKALTKQLEEKDKQIERLMVLLDQQQRLQAQSHYLLGTADQDQTPQPAPGSEDPAADPHPGPDPDPQPAEPPKKKRSFWSWLFE